jgi:ABC-type dipeptide/oligopeptide/nickel transport system permease subunit
VIYPPIPYAPNEIQLSEKYERPGGGHLLGTDRLGRDVLAGLIHGTRYSLTIGLVSVGISMIIGLVLGAVAGFLGGWVDLFLSRIIELWAAIPPFFLIITAAAFEDGLPVAGTIMNHRQVDDRGDVSLRTNVSEIERCSFPPVLASVAYNGTLDRNIDWLQLAQQTLT